LLLLLITVTVVHTLQSKYEPQTSNNRFQPPVEATCME